MIHLIVIFLHADSIITNKLDEFSIQKGITVSLTNFSKNKIDTYNFGKRQIDEDFTQDNKGTIIEEVNEIRNSIQYPPDALEQGLETECEWKVLIGENKNASKVELIKPCKYKIFETEFLKVIGSWKFKSPEGVWIEIPIRFKIEKEKD